VIKNGKEIFRLVEADKIPDYPFLYEANKVRFAEGQISNITKYPNGKWKTAVFERVNGYKFNLSFKPNAPDLNSIKWGDHVRLRFIHEVKTGEKTYKINDWVAISTDIKDYGIKNPEWFSKFYEVVNEKQRTGAIKTTDTVRVSALRGAGVEALGVKPLVLIDGVEYSKDILYKISQRGLKGTTVYYPNNGETKYGEKAKDGAMIIETKNGVITYLADIERENNLKIRAEKGKFFSRVRLTKDDGTEYDQVKITRASGGYGMDDIVVNGKVAFIISDKIYTEAQFKRLFPADIVDLGRSIRVGPPTKDHTDRGFKLDGYSVVFEFTSANIQATNKPVKTGAVTPGKKVNSNNTGIVVNNIPQSKLSNSSIAPQYRSWSSGANVRIGKPALLTGGQSDFRGNNIRTIGFTVRYPRVSKPEYVKPADESKKQGETVPEGKDTVGNRKRALNEAMANLPELEVRADGSTWFKGQPVKRVMIDGKEYKGGVSQAINTLPAEMIDKVKVTNTPRILVDGKEFIPTEIKDKVKVINNTPKILVDGKEFIPTEIKDKVKVTNTPRILVDGKEFIPTEIKDKVKVINNTPKILVDGKEFIPNNTDMKKDLLNSVPKVKTAYKKPNDSLVAARFSGKVITVKDIMGTQLIIIKNGDYFAAYSNLKDVNVSVGQEIKAGQLLGSAAAFNAEENKVAAHFELYRRQNLITDKTEQETILKNFESPKLNMMSDLKNMYAYFLPKANKRL
jgi:hypothetical protein